MVAKDCSTSSKAIPFSSRCRASISLHAEATAPSRICKDEQHVKDHIHRLLLFSMTFLIDSNILVMGQLLYYGAQLVELPSALRNWQA